MKRIPEGEGRDGPDLSVILPRPPVSPIVAAKLTYTATLQICFPLKRKYLNMKQLSLGGKYDNFNLIL